MDSPRDLSSDTDDSEEIDVDVEDIDADVDVEESSHISDAPSPTNEPQLLGSPEPEDEFDGVDASTAPILTVPARAFGAVEIPMVIQNMDRAMRAFGRAPVFDSVSSSP